MSRRTELKNLFNKLLYRPVKPDSDDSLSPAPWDPWELDPKFFQMLAQWNHDHPESSFQRVYEKVNTAFERLEPAFEAIPDSPFPARGLVTALAYLLKLGWQVMKAKSDVQEFASQIVQWVTEMTAAFGDGRMGQFGRKTKKNLEKRSGLIHEICTWAAARLNDKRWQQLIKALDIPGEIVEFNTRIAEARALFMDLSVVNLSQGLDELLRQIDIVRELQYRQHADTVRVLEAQKQAKERQKFLDGVLQSRIVANPTYDEQGKRPCDPETRVEILAGIKAWIHDLSNNGKSFLWLTGDPGSGKSAITASIARECKDTGILWAQFFINRNSVETTNPKSFFPSIARQLADHIPDSEVAKAIHDALKKQQSLVDDISAEQALKLFVDAMNVAAKLDPSKPVVVVIDGLDESTRARLADTAKIFSTLFKTLRCPNAKVFIASRTDDDITRPFSEAYHVDYVKHIHLDTSDESSVRDVTNFITSSLQSMVQSRKLDWEVWPGEERLEALCSRASGLFIWAVTSLKFIQGQFEIFGKECLNRVLDTLTREGMGDINVLYEAILHVTYKTHQNPYGSDWAYETFRRVVGCIVTAREPLSVGVIGELLDLRQTKEDDPVDLINFVSRLRTVLVAGTDAVEPKTVPRLHKSFFEYITSPRAEVRFRVSLEVANGEILTQCLLHLAGFHQSHCKIPPDQKLSLNAVDFVPAAVQYAVSFWESHTPQEAGAASGIVVVPGLLSFDKFQAWLWLSAKRKAIQRPLGISFLPDKPRIITSWDETIQVWGSSGHPFPAPPPEGHSGEVDSVTFSPDGTLVASGSYDNTIRLWNAQNGQPIGSPLQGHSNIVFSLAFSPDGLRLVSGSADHTLRLWNVQSGQPIGSPLHGHEGWVRSVGFSPDGGRLVSSSDDKTLRLWDAHSGQPIGSPLQGHTGYVYSVAFSPDGTHLVSGGADKDLRLWDLQNSELIGSPLLGHTGNVYSVAFSSDGTRVVSGSEDKTIRLWNAQSGHPVGFPLQGHNSTVFSVAFSPDGKWLVSGGHDCTIRLWDAQSGHPIGSPLQGHIIPVTSVACSPDGTRLVSGSWDSTIQFWDVQTRKPTGPQLTFGHNGRVSSMAVFPDGGQLVSASLNDVFRIWQIRNGEVLGTLPCDGMAGIVSVTISPDCYYVAAVDLAGGICLWTEDTYSGFTLLSKVESHVEGLVSLSFSSNGEMLVLSRMDGSVSRWSVADDKLSALSTPSNSTISRSQGTLSFDRAQGWKRGDQDSQGETLLQWLPSDDPDAGVWAYVDGSVIRKTGPDSVIIFELGGDVGEEGVST